MAHILVVDDSPVVLSLVRGLLEGAGHEVSTADNPLTVPNLVRHTTFDLALVDLNMPAITGDTVITILSRSGLASTRVLLFSDTEEAELKAKATACGALGYIKKGPDDHLLKQVARFLKLAH